MICLGPHLREELPGSGSAGYGLQRQERAHGPLASAQLRPGCCRGGLGAWDQACSD